MRRTALKPGKARLQTKQPLKAKKRLPQVGKRKKREIDETQAIRREYLRTQFICEIGEALRAWAPYDKGCKEGHDQCLIASSCIHERKKRSQGGSLTDPANLMATCVPCNGWVEDHPATAWAMGVWVLSHEDPREVPVNFPPANTCRNTPDQV